MDLVNFKNSDYTCCPDEEKPEEFWTYLADRKYDLIPGDDYLQKIKSKNLISRDSRTAWFAHRSVRVGAIFFGSYWSVLRRTAPHHPVPGRTGSGAWIPAHIISKRGIRR